MRSSLKAVRIRNQGGAKIFGSKGRPACLGFHGAKKLFLVGHDRDSSLSELERIARFKG